MSTGSVGVPGLALLEKKSGRSRKREGEEKEGERESVCSVSNKVEYKYSTVQ